MMDLGIRIAVTGEGEDERFTVVDPSPDPKRRGHTMTTWGPMTEAEFRAELASRGVGQALIDETVAGARAHPRT